MRHAVITAGSKGIGRKVTEEFLRKGCSVTVNYRSDLHRIEELKREWATFHDRLQFVQGDISNKADIATIIQQAMNKFGRIDYFINNAGPYIFERKKLVDYEESEWKQIIDGNLSSVFYFLKLIIPVMRAQKFGRVITYGFQDAEHAPGWRFRSAFSAAKVGLVSLTRTIALEEAEFGITANMVCPGDIVGEWKESTIEVANHSIDKHIPVGRPGTGEDIARVIAFLCEENSSFITGSVISVSGGINVVNKVQTTLFE